MKIKIDIIHFINAPPPPFFFFVDAEASQLKAFQLFLLGHIFYTYIHTYMHVLCTTCCLSSIFMYRQGGQKDIINNVFYVNFEVL